MVSASTRLNPLHVYLFIWFFCLGQDCLWLRFDGVRLGSGYFDGAARGEARFEIAAMPLRNSPGRRVAKHNVKTTARGFLVGHLVIFARVSVTKEFRGVHRGVVRLRFQY
jgi:hypothetical protein